MKGKCRDLLLLIVLSFFAFFIHNQALKPDIMECRNMVAAREIVESGRWLVPTMNGQLRLKKPPLPTWLTAATYAVRPDSLALQRGMAGIFGLLLVLGFYETVRELTGRRREALFAALVLITCYNVVLMGRTASWDIYCHAFVVLALPPLIRALRGRGRQWRDFLLAGLLVGLSFMSKGPISLYALLLPFLVVFCLTERPRLRGKWLPLGCAIVLCAAVSSWWYVYLYIAEPQAIASVVEQETGNWTNYNVRPFWYYWRFWAETGLWALLLLTAIFLPLGQRRSRHDRNYLLPLTWMLLSVVLLSLFPEKKMRYLLPVMIPAAATMGWLIETWTVRFHRLQAGGADAVALRLNAWLSALVVAVLPVAVWIEVASKGYIGVPRFVLVAVCLLACAFIFLLAGLRRRPVWLLTGGVLLFVTVEALLLPVAGAVMENPKAHSITAVRTDPRLRGIPFYSPEGEELRIEEVWAAGRVIAPIPLNHADSIAAKLPCAVLTHEPPSEAFPAALWSVADSTVVGRFDDNITAPGTRRYRSLFIYYVTLLTPRR